VNVIKLALDIKSEQDEITDKKRRNISWGLNAFLAAFAVIGIYFETRFYFSINPTGTDQNTAEALIKKTELENKGFMQNYK